MSDSSRKKASETLTEGTIRLSPSSCDGVSSPPNEQTCQNAKESSAKLGTKVFALARNQVVDKLGYHSNRKRSGEQEELTAYQGTVKRVMPTQKVVVTKSFRLTGTKQALLQREYDNWQAFLQGNRMVKLHSDTRRQAESLLKSRGRQKIQEIYPLTLRNSTVNIQQHENKPTRFRLRLSVAEVYGGVKVSLIFPRDQAQLIKDCQVQEAKLNWKGGRWNVRLVFEKEKPVLLIKKEIIKAKLLELHGNDERRLRQEYKNYQRHRYKRLFGEKAQTHLLKQEYENFQCYLHGDRGVPLYSNTKQYAEQLVKRIGRPEEGREYPLVLHWTVCRLFHAETKLTQYWLKIPIGGRWGGVHVPVLLYSPITSEMRVLETKIVRRNGEWYAYITVQTGVQEKTFHYNLLHDLYVKKRESLEEIAKETSTTIQHVKHAIALNKLTQPLLWKTRFDGGWADLNTEQQQLLLGTLMGDAHVTFPRYRKPFASLRLGQCQPEYVKWKISVLREFFTGQIRKATRINQKTHMVHHFYHAHSYPHPLFNELRRLFYPNGVKVVTREILDQIDAFGLAVWVMDDGSGNKIWPGELHLSTNSSPLAEQKIMKKWFKEQWNVEAIITRANLFKKQYYLRFNSEDSRKLANIIRPYVLPLFFYKLHVRNSVLKRQFPRSKPSRKIIIDADWLREQYLAERKAAQKIADELGVSRTTILDAIHRYEIPIRERLWDKPKIDAAWLREQYLVKQRSIRDIAREMKVSFSTIQTKIHGNGILTRAPHKQPKITNADWLREQYLVKHRTMQDMANEVSVSRCTVGNALRRCNLLLNH